MYIQRAMEEKKKKKPTAKKNEKHTLDMLEY